MWILIIMVAKSIIYRVNYLRDWRWIAWPICVVDDRVKALIAPLPEDDGGGRSEIKFVLKIIEMESKIAFLSLFLLAHRRKK